MSIFQKPGPQDLYEWLVIATRELVIPAKRRIWEEITSHYEEAEQRHLQNGLPTASAQAAALAELGDARAAARRFRRAHLTVSEIRKVAELLKSCQPSLWVHFSGVVGCFWLGSVLGGQHGCPAPFTLFSLIAMVVLLTVYETVAFVLSRRKTPRRVIQMEMGGWLMTGTVCVCMFRMFWGLPMFRWPCVFFDLNYLIVLMNILYYLRLSNKVGKADQDWMGESALSP